MTISDEIKRLHDLHLSGALTDAEFADAKAKLLAKFGRDGGQIKSSEGSGIGVDHTLSLRRSKTDRWLGGICGGLARSTGMESWLWRLLFVLFMLYFGTGLLIYVLGWIFIPEEE